jgi:hypothetical protein
MIDRFAREPVPLDIPVFRGGAWTADGGAFTGFPAPLKCSRCSDDGTGSCPRRPFPRQRLASRGAPTTGVAALNARLASGWLADLCREKLNPLDRDERFQNFMFILLS